MSYIWSEYDTTNNFEIEECFFSQFLETGPKLPQFGNYVGVNPLLRFEKMFNLWMEKRYDLVKSQVVTDEDRKVLENTCFHFLALIDRICGVHLCSVEEFKLEQALKKGLYGEEIKGRYVELRDSEQKIILKWLRKYEKEKGRILFFNEVLRELFFGCRFYYNQLDNKYVVFIKQEGNEYDISVFEMVKLLFMDITASVYVFWRYHFGIIGQDSVMQIGNISVY